MHGSLARVKNHRPRLEMLESRDLLSNTILYNAASQVLSIDGSNAGDTVIVTQLAANQVSVTLTHPGSALSPLSQLVTGPISEIYFTGHAGIDYFRNDTAIACMAFGGSGDNVLIGGAGNDILYGGAGSNQLYGRGGNDTLHGGAGANELYGGDGNDLLFGGNGTNALCGGPGHNLDFAGNGINRFLDESGNDTILGQTSKDARINFVGTLATQTLDAEKVVGTHAAWTDSDVQAVDFALAQIEQRTGNTRLLKMPDGSPLTFIRQGHSTTPNSALLGFNSHDGNIFVLDATFADTTWLHRTIYHEIGHNWEDASVNSSWYDFANVSGWAYGDPTASDLLLYTHATQTDPEWWYLKGSTFTRDYGRANVWEDWATSFEAYFAQTYTHETDAGANLAPAKIAIVNQFLDSETT